MHFKTQSLELKVLPAETPAGVVDKEGNNGSVSSPNPHMSEVEQEETRIAAGVINPVLQESLLHDGLYKPECWFDDIR